MSNFLATRFFSELPSIYKKAGLLPVAAPRHQNSFWQNYGFPSLVFGTILTTIGIMMLPLEVSRIIKGSLNRGNLGSYYLYPNYNSDANFADALIQAMQNNFKESNLPNKGIVPFSAISAGGKTPHNYPIQDKYLWPWSHAALLFSLVTTAAGFLGILSGCRQTYSSIFAFFVLSLLSGFLSIFLVAYYSTQVYWQLNKNNSNKDKNIYAYVDYGLGSALLAISCFNLIVSFAAALYAARSIGIGKGPKSPLLKMPQSSKLIGSRVLPEAPYPVTYPYSQPQYFTKPRL